MNSVLFNDANQYFDLYGFEDGKKLLDPIKQQRPTFLFSRTSMTKFSGICARKFFSDKPNKIKKIANSGNATAAHLARKLDTNAIKFNAWC